MNRQSAPWAPVAVFIYKRPEHARRAIASLQACEGADSSPIYVFADGPRTDTEATAVMATRAVAHELLGSRAVFVEQDHNRGLADSIIAGVTDLCDRYGAVITVEEDLVLSRSFLRFLNHGLQAYSGDAQVMQISGHIVDVPALEHQREALFLPMTTSWGWATWKRAWDLFDPLSTGWHERLGDRAAARRFNLGGHYDYRRMLQRQMAGEIDSWAIRWYYSVFARHGLALFPPRSLVRYDGFDGSGTHGRFSRRASVGTPVVSGEWLMPGRVTESPAKGAVFEAIARANRRDFWRTLRALVRPGVLRSGSRTRPPSHAHPNGDNGSDRHSPGRTG
jgi:hypothetical protein